MTDIILIVIGLIVVLVSFLMTGKEKDTTSTQQELKLSDEQLDACFDSIEAKMQKRFLEMLSEARDETVVKADDELGRLADEKQLQMEETAKAILEKMDGNHQESVFLYKMLTEKEEKLKEELTMIEQAVYQHKKELQSRLEELSLEEISLQRKRKEVQKMQQQANDMLRQAQQSYQSSKQLDDDERRLEQLLKEEATPDRVRKTNTRPDVPDRVFKGEPEYSRPNEPELNRNERILGLYHEGKTVLEISQELQMGQGEVQLVIDLFERN